MTIAYAYCRVSTERQHKSTLSIREQVRQVIAYAHMKGYDLGAVTQVDIDGTPFESRDRVVIEPASAYKKKFLERQGGAALSKMMNRGDQLIFAKLDRGFRNVADALRMLELWDARGIGAHFLDMNVDTGTAIGKMMLTIIAAVAEMESARRSERVLDAIRAKRAKRFESMIRGDFAYPGFRFVNVRDKARRRMVPDESQRWKLDLFYEMWAAGWSNIDIVDFARKKRILRTDEKFYDQNNANAVCNVEHGLRRIEAEFLSRGHTPTYEEAATTWLARFIESGGTAMKLCAFPRSGVPIPRVLELKNPGPFPVPDRKQPKWLAFK